ncbi:TM2 domain-containing protein 3 isoform X2 [Brachyhypopomus gauderio]|uniref:TM2 domain-containing protein 3 isoform X2 n=1 Tax=Brachyhypopomus gauderio TaxID=698409 RepID=UPI0040421319
MKFCWVLSLLLVDVVFRSASDASLSSTYVSDDAPHGTYTPPRSSGKPSSVSSTTSESPVDGEKDTAKCPSGGLCSKLPADCFVCSYHHNCSYGKPANFICKTKAGVHCVDGSNRQQTTFNLTVTCQFCWQLDPSQYRCNTSSTCTTVACPRERYNATCRVLEHVSCLGKREFHKRLFCNWTGGYRWSTTLTLRHKTR